MTPVQQIPHRMSVLILFLWFSLLILTGCSPVILKKGSQAVFFGEDTAL